MPKFNSIDAYLSQLTPFHQTRLNELRALVKSIFLNVQESMMAYSIVFFMPEEMTKKFHQRRLMMMSAFQTHININASAIAHYREELKDYHFTPKGMLQIKDHQPLPKELLAKIIRETLIEEPKKHDKTLITVEALIQKPIAQVWGMWTEPDHITQWTFADPSWHAPWATNDLRVGGKYTTRMEAKDGSEGFEFWGIYDTIKPHQLISSKLGDGRTLEVRFESVGKTTKVIETFEAETTYPLEQQRFGWQAILNNFKTYAESRK